MARHCSSLLPTLLLCSLVWCLGVAAGGTGPAPLPWPGTTRVVELHDANMQDLPSLLLGSGAEASRGGAPGSFLVHGTSHKRHRQYVVPAGYNQTENGTLADTLQLPDERGGLKLSRWVVCSWRVANISAADAVRNKNNVFLERIPELLRSVQNLAPSQVYAVAAANITLGFTFTGVASSSLTPAATQAMKQAASDMAGGYSTHLITVSNTPPPARGSEVAFEGKVQDVAPAAAPGVVKRGKDLGLTTAAAAAPPPQLSAGRRRRLTGSAAQQQGSAALSLTADGGAVLPRRLLLRAAAAAPKAARAAKASRAAAGASTAAMPVWLLYKHVAPANTTTLLTELCLSCNVTPTVAVGYDFARQPCGRDVKAALVAAGVKVDEDTYSQVLSEPPSVSLSVRLAVGMTAAQVATGADVALAQWLAEPATAQAVARMYAPDAVISWLHRPEIWYQSKASPPAAVSPGAAAGIAIAATVTVCAAIGLAVWLIHGRKRKQAAAAADKQDDMASQSSGRRRRRREGKRRYLLPDPPRPDSSSNGDGAGPSSSGVPGPEAALDELEEVEDAELSPDQIRPHLRSLGDSVTSAVRYEQSDDEEGEEDSAGQAGSSAAAAAQAGDTAGPSAASAAGAVGALAAAGAAAAAASSSRTGAASSSSTAARSRSVLEAREQLVAEYAQQQGSQPQQSSSSLSGPSTASSSRGVVPGAAWDGAPAAVSPELAAAAELSSAVAMHSGPDSTSAAAGLSSVHTAGSMPEHTPHLKPVDERAAAASAAAVAAAAALPQAGAVAASGQRRSPFACSYNFGELADTPTTSPDPAAAAAAMAAASAKAVALPPRGLPVSPTSRGSPTRGEGSGCERKGSAGSSSGGSLQSLAASGGGHNGSSGGSPGSAAGDAGGSKGVGLQQLVSISPIRAPDAAGGGGYGSSMQGFPGLASQAASNGSACTSVLQGATDSYESTLMLSSSVSGPVPHPSSTSQGTLSGGGTAAAYAAAAAACDKPAPGKAAQGPAASVQ